MARRTSKVIGCGGGRAILARLMSEQPTSTVDEVKGPRALVAFLVMTVLLTAVDLVTKHLAFEHIGPWPNKIVVIPGFFDLINSKNEGAAFGQLQGQYGFF